MENTEQAFFTWKMQSPHRDENPSLGQAFYQTLGHTPVAAVDERVLKTLDLALVLGIEVVPTDP